MSNILVVESDQELCSLYTRILKKAGYGVRSANGLGQVRGCMQTATDLILTNGDLPDGSGLELIRTLRETGNAIPVLMIGSKECLDRIHQSLLSGLERFLMQPVRMSDLLDGVRSLLFYSQGLAKRQLMVGNTVLRGESCTVDTAGDTKVLPREEFDLLLQLAASPDKILTDQQLLKVSGGKQENLKKKIAHLQQEFRDSPDFHIVWMRGVGYKLCLDRGANLFAIS